MKYQESACTERSTPLVHNDHETKFYRLNLLELNEVSKENCKTLTKLSLNWLNLLTSLHLLGVLLNSFNVLILYLVPPENCDVAERNFCATFAFSCNRTFFAMEHNFG